MCWGLLAVFASSCFDKELYFVVNMVFLFIDETSPQFISRKRYFPIIDYLTQVLTHTLLYIVFRQYFASRIIIT